MVATLLLAGLRWLPERQDSLTRQTCKIRLLDVPGSDGSTVKVLASTKTASVFDDLSTVKVVLQLSSIVER